MQADYGNILNYRDTAVINEAHGVFLVQHIDTGEYFVKKYLSVYNLSVYESLFRNPISGTPRIYCLYEAGGYLTVIEEYIKGTTLAELIRKHSLTPKLIRSYMGELCTIVGRLHHFRPPIIHRDIKPSNIIIDPAGQVVLLDFNAAKFFNQDASDDTVKLGTQGYAAPEQFGFGASTVQTDIYAIGITLKEAAASLDKGSSKKRRNHEFDEIIKRCTRLDAAQRYASVTLLKYELVPKGGILQRLFPQLFAYNKFLPPGFRRFSLPHMLIAVYCYYTIPKILIETDTGSSDPEINAAVKTGMVLSFFVWVLLICDYCGIQKHLPFCRSKNSFARFSGLCFWCTIITICIATACYVIM